LFVELKEKNNRGRNFEKLSRNWKRNVRDWHETSSDACLMLENHPLQGVLLTRRSRKGGD
jgi:hypothetical protein